MKTIGEIQEVLVSIGARKIVCDYTDEGNPDRVTFTIAMNSTPVYFSLPANYKGVLKAMENDRKVPRSACNEAQALRVSWRILKDWIEAQCAIIQSGLVESTEAFLPYAITKSGETLYKEIQGKSNNLLLTQ